MSQRYLNGSVTIAKQIDRYRFHKGVALEALWFQVDRRYPWLGARFLEQTGKALTRKVWLKRVKGKAASDQQKRGNYPNWEALAQEVLASGQEAYSEEYLARMADRHKVFEAVADSQYIYIYEVFDGSDLVGHKIGKDNGNSGQTENRLRNTLRQADYELGSRVLYVLVGPEEGLALKVEREAHDFCRKKHPSFIGRECFRITGESAIRAVQHALTLNGVDFGAADIVEIKHDH